MSRTAWIIVIVLVIAGLLAFYYQYLRQKAVDAYAKWMMNQEEAGWVQDKLADPNNEGKSLRDIAYEDAAFMWNSGGLDLFYGVRFGRNPYF